MYRLTLQRCSQWKEIVWGPKFPSTVQSKALCYPVLERRYVITTARKCCPVQVEPGVLGDHSRICTDCGLVCSSRQAILITKVSGFVLGCWVVFFKNFFLGVLADHLQPILSSDPASEKFRPWAANLLNVFTKAAGNHCFYSHKTSVVFTKRSQFSMWCHSCWRSSV